MSDTPRGLLRAVTEGARDRAVNGRRRLGTWLRRIAPASVLLRLTVGVAFFIAAELAVPSAWAASALYLFLAGTVALTAALLPGSRAPLIAAGVTVGAWLVSTALYDGHDPALWLAAPIGLLLYTGHTAASIAQRFRTTTAVDGEIILTWARHLGIIAASTVSFAVLLALFTSYFAAIPPTVAVGVGVVAAVTVIYVLARSLHKPSPR
ncbi:hypothetical protein GCM10027447_03190 [Glycomyces halotolerans]